MLVKDFRLALEHCINVKGKDFPLTCDEHYPVDRINNVFSTSDGTLVNIITFSIYDKIMREKPFTCKEALDSVSSLCTSAVVLVDRCEVVGFDLNKMSLISEVLNENQKKKLNNLKKEAKNQILKTVSLLKTMPDEDKKKFLNSWKIIKKLGIIA